jgi:hypothetical protein
MYNGGQKRLTTTKPMSGLEHQREWPARAWNADEEEENSREHLEYDEHPTIFFATLNQQHFSSPFIVQIQRVVKRMSMAAAHRVMTCPSRPMFTMLAMTGRFSRVVGKLFSRHSLVRARWPQPGARAHALWKQS